MDRLKDSELLSTTDAQVWAQQFNLVFAELHEGCELDEGWLIGWFANAIETGRAAGKRQSLSQEAVRDEALEEAAKVCSSHVFKGTAIDDLWLDGANTACARLAAAIRTLKREPNAAGQVSSRTQIPEQSGQRPAPAAPDVASVVKRLEELQSAWLPDIGECYPITFTPAERTALLARLGQRIETRKESEHPSNYEFPPAPGASDD